MGDHKGGMEMVKTVKQMKKKRKERNKITNGQAYRFVS